MINIEQLDKYVVQPVLEHLGMNSLAARRLMIGTALAESHGKYIHQIGDGPALGLWQVEPSTHMDNYVSFLEYPSRRDLYQKFVSLRGDFPKAHNQMIGNLSYNCAHARLKYWRSPKKMPNENDYRAMAEYHKDIYNSSLGKADIENNVCLFEMACKNIK